MWGARHQPSGRDDPTMGVEPERAAGSLRISLSRGTTHAELDQAVEVFEAVLSLIRRQGTG